MADISTSKFKKKNKILSNLIKVVKKTMVVTNTFTVYFPNRFEKAELVYITDVVKLLGVFIVVNDKGEYCLINRPSILTMEPSAIDLVTMDEVEYYALTFHPGNLFMTDTSTVKNDSFVFTIFDEFMIRGNIPWYIEYEDILTLFTGAHKYAGSNLMNNSLPMEGLISILGKAKSDPRNYYRQVIKDKNETRKLKFVALSNIFEGYNNTVSKLTGNYLKDGMISAMVNPQEEATEIEKVILT